MTPTAGKAGASAAEKRKISCTSNDNDENEEKSTRRDAPERTFEEVAEKLENVEKHFTYFNRSCWLLDGKLANT